MKKQIKDGVLYGMGYIIGKHNLPDIPKKQREKIANDFAEEVVKNISSKQVVIGSFCLHKGCKKQSTCGDYCGTHCNCRKKAK